MQKDNAFLLTALVSLQKHLGIHANDGTDPTLEMVRVVLQDQLNMFRDLQGVPGAADPEWLERMITALEFILAYVNQTGAPSNAALTSASCAAPQSLP